MELNLHYKPSVKTVSRFAEDTVNDAREISKVELDYTEESLDDVDAIVQGFIEEGLDVDYIKETLFSFGCYLGEVIARTTGGKWIELEPGDEVLDKFGWPLIVQFPNGTRSNPIGKLFKRFEYGESNNLRHYFRLSMKVAGRESANDE